MEKRIYVRVGLGAAALVGFFAASILSQWGLQLIDYVAILRDFRSAGLLLDLLINVFISVVPVNAFVHSLLSKEPFDRIWRSSLLLPIAMTATVPPYVVLAVQTFIGPGSGPFLLLGAAFYLVILIFGWRLLFRLPAWRQGIEGWGPGRRIMYILVSVSYAGFVTILLFILMSTRGL